MAGHRAATFSSLDGCELVALAARNSETGAELAGKHDLTLTADWQELVRREDVDAVAVCTNNDSHAVMASAALEAGKHVFLEYPLARHLEDAERLVKLVQDSDRVLRVAHNESYSAGHRGLKRAVSSMGPLLTALFVRLTPGRGARPEMLFNLEVSGPPALFFVYQIYPLVDLFGPAEWVEGYAEYLGLGDSGQYDRFVNTVTVGFASGGQAQWTWAGGVAIAKADQYQRLVLGEGTLMNEAGTGWMRSSADGVEVVETDEQASASMEEMFLQEVLGEQELWREDLVRSLDASRISAGAERAATEGGRVVI
jgi:biliverdin reductase